jgi:hypothetical protein
MQTRYGALGAAILLGIVWSAWHIVAMVQKSVFAVALYHASANVSTKTIFPGGSYHAEGIISLILVVAAGLVALVWGPRMLTGHRTAEAGAR